MLHQNNLHFLRFLLACMVVLGHAYALTDPDHAMGYSGSVFFSSLTALAVNAFFIISGYLIYQSLMRAASFKQYTKNRLLRIVPLWILVIVVTVVVCGFIYEGTLASYWTQRSTWTYMLRNFTFFGLIHYIDGVFASNPKPHINGSLWSIPYELLCYFLFSPLLFLGKKCSKVTVDRLLQISFSVLVIVFVIIHFFEFIAVGERVETALKCVMLFYMGVMLGRFYPQRLMNMPTMIVAFITFAFLYYGRYFFDMDNWYTLAIFPFALIVIYLSFWPNKVLPKFAKWGDASYGIYLMAFPIQQLFIAIQPSWHPLLNFCCTMAVVIPLAYWAWHRVEAPILSLKGR